MAMGMTNEPEFDPEDGFWIRNRIAVITGAAAVLILGVAAFFMLRTAETPPPPPPQTVTIIAIKPPPPPPPPPPVQQQMIQQPKITTPIPKPMQPAPPTKVAAPKPAAPAATPIGTSIKGNSSNNFDLSGTPGGDGLLGGGGGGSGAWSYYSSVITGQIRDALQQNGKTRDATAGLQVQIYVDASGVIQRVMLTHPSGNPDVDEAIENQVLLHMKLAAAPPQGMPMPINVSLVGQAPL